MREDDALAVLVELDNLEVEFLVHLGCGAIFLGEVLGSSEAFHTVGESYNGALVEHFHDGAFMHGTYSENGFEHVPGIFLELLVAKGETAVVLVDLENFHFDVGTDLGEFAGVFDFLCPGKVGDVDKTVHAFFDFHEHTEVGEVAHLGGVAAADGIFGFDVLPGIGLELLDAEAHLAVVAVEGEHNGFDFVAFLEEILSGAQVLAPAHLAHVDKTFHAGSHFEECTVVGHNHYAAFNLVADLEVGVEGIPGMGLELLETEGDTFFLVVEVQDNDIELLVELDNFAGVFHAAPGEVGDVDKAVDTAEVDEHTVGGDVLHSAFEYLTLLQLGDDFALLGFQFGFDECLVRYNHVLELFVDFHNLEFHGLANEHIVVADGLHVDLAAGEECLDAEHVHNHAAFGAAFDEAFDDFVVFKCGVDALPRTGCTCLFVRQNQLSLAVFLVFDENLYCIADFDVGIVAEFAHGDDTVGFVVDVNHSLTLVEGDDGTFDYFFVFDRVQGFLVGVGEFVAAAADVALAVLIGIPVEILDR